MENLRDFKTCLLDPKDPKSDNTVSAYIHAAQEFLDKTTDPEKITKKDIDTYIGYLSADGLKLNTKLLRLAGLRAYLTFKERGDLKLYIEKTTFKANRNDVKKVNYSEIFERIEELRKKDKFAIRRDRLMFYILAESGTRVSELIALTFEDFDLKNKKMSIWQTKQRTWREADITDNIAKALENYLANGEKLPFKLSRQAVDQILKGYFLKFSAHKLRHYFITQHAKKVKNPYILQQVTGHKKAESAERYINLVKNDVDDYYKQNKIKRPFRLMT